jgi:hypothetical protein
MRLYEIYAYMMFYPTEVPVLVLRLEYRQGTTNSVIVTLEVLEVWVLPLQCLATSWKLEF